ncbi:MAG: addiction module protein [Luteolibacter sp.]|uniref:addiction module protein n=1 Tax=Luteolibacter sp. TaxID=1962973 RepID=UPI003265C94D
MRAIAEQLFNEAQALDCDERIALAEKLIESVSSESEIFAAHLVVAHERLEEILSGKVTPVTREDTLKQVQELLRKGSAA